MEILGCRELGSDWEATRLEALRWIALLLDRHRTEVFPFTVHRFLYLVISILIIASKLEDLTMSRSCD